MARSMIYVLAGGVAVAGVVLGVMSLAERGRKGSPLTSPAAMQQATTKGSESRPAAGSLEAAVEGDPKNVKLRVEWARQLAAAGNVEGASKQYDIATSLEPKRDDLWHEWGQLLLAAKKPADAEEKFRKALNLKGAVPAYHIALGKALREVGKYGSALNSFEQARDLDEKSPEAFLELGNTLVGMGQEANAETNFRAALHLKPEGVEEQVVLARFLMTAKDPARRNLMEATTLLQQAVGETQEKDLSLLVAYADALEKAGLPEQALEMMTKALARAKEVNLPGVQQELIRAGKQRIEVALAGPLEHGHSRLTLLGTPWEMEPEPPMPPVPEARVEDLLGVRFDLTKPFALPTALLRAPEAPFETGNLQ